MLTDLACPDCQHTLEADGDKIGCVSCEFEGLQRDGIIDLRCGRHDYYFNPVPKPIMHELVKLKSPDDWPKVIHGFMATVKQNPDWIDNLVVNGRYAWKMFLDLPDDAICLDIGAGLGNLVHNLAPQVKKFYALDLTWERLEFSKLRFSHFNKDDDIQLLAGGDGAYLPFKENSLDCVTVSGVLEWIPDDNTLWETDGGKIHKALLMFRSFFGATNPRHVQIKFLKEIRRVLKPDGQLFIGIENRHNYEYFDGRVDHHTNLKFGSLLPRFISNLYSIYSRRYPYRTYTHSRKGYTKLLRKAGFPTARFLGLLNGYSNLNQILPFDFEQNGWQLLRPKSPKMKIIRHRNHVPAYGIVAGQQMESTRRPLIDRVLKEISAHCPKIDEHGTVFSDFQVTGKDKGVIFGQSDQHSFVIKLPFSKAGLSAERNNSQTLGHLQNVGGSPVNVPTPLTAGTYQGVPYFVETQCAGRPLIEMLNAANRAKYAEQGFIAWKNLQLLEPSASPSVSNDENFESIITEYSDRIFPYIDLTEDFDRLLADLRETLIGYKISTGVFHGDFSVRNLMIKNDTISGLVDWESSSLLGLPILDLVGFFVSLERATNKSSFAHAINSITADDADYPDERALLSNGFDHCRIPENRRSLFVALYWMSHLSARMETNFVFQSEKLSQAFIAFEEFLQELK